MRVRFRIGIYDEEGKRLSKDHFLSYSTSLHRGMRYVLEFKYLEATKWLMLAQDSTEKYLLLGLLNIALGQEREGLDFLQEAQKHKRATFYLFAVEKPETGFKLFIEKIEASLLDSLLSL
ncbi:MAG: hypothetical protein RMH93_02355 [Aquificaceae bacterium]|nr:hypothetical protein [Aquificaceae bacterium]